MKKEIADLWVKALPEYLQGRSALCISFGGEVRHCCLGVLCEIAVKHGVTKKKLPKGQNNYRYGVGAVGLGRTNYLPSEVQEWAGMRTSDGSFGEEGNSLVTMNDTGMTFKQIAESVKELWEEL